MIREAAAAIAKMQRRLRKAQAQHDALVDEVRTLDMRVQRLLATVRSQRPPALVDIAVNLTDPMFRGCGAAAAAAAARPLLPTRPPGGSVYRGKERHADDMDDVLGRAREAGVARMLVTGTSAEDSAAALALCRDVSGRHGIGVACTVGCHPTNAAAFVADAARAMASIRATVAEGRAEGAVAALGECGLDYARLEFAPKGDQLACFEAQLDLAAELRLPLFLHLRDAGDDFVRLVAPRAAALVGGVVHSYDGTPELARELLALGLFIGINGCSLRTPENCATVAGLPLDRLMLETDAPWCDMRPTHASHPHVRTHPELAKKPDKFNRGMGVKGARARAGGLRAGRLTGAGRQAATSRRWWSRWRRPWRRSRAPPWPRWPRRRPQTPTRSSSGASPWP